MTEKNITIGLITYNDPNDQKSWSGTYYHMLKEIKTMGFKVEKFGPYKFNLITKYGIKFLSVIIYLFHIIVFQKRCNVLYSKSISLIYGKLLTKSIEKSKTIDILFVPAFSPGVAFLKTNIPIVYYNDATVDLLIDYYPSLSNYSRLAQNNCIYIEQKAISNSDVHVFSSDWAMNNANLRFNAKNAFVVKMGANIINDPILDLNNKIYNQVINILFVGVDWHRKGGDLVVETMNKLIEKGFNVQLTVIGCIPPVYYDYIKVIPSINKNIDQDKRLFDETLKKAHLFFLPTRAECFGLVFCEANAYGLPVIATKTGGVPSIIKDGVNGYLLSPSETSEEYYRVIKNLIVDTTKFRQMAINARLIYERELSWKVWGEKMGKIFIDAKFKR